MLETASMPLGFLLRRAQRAHTSLWYDVFQGDLTGAQYSTMLAICRWPGSDQQAVSDLVGLDKATLGGIIDRLRKRGRVTRRSNPDDLRRYILELTPQGAREMPAFYERAMTVHRQLVALLPPGTADEFVELLVAVAYEPGCPPHEPRVADPGFPVMDLPTSVGHLIRRTHQRYQAVWSETFEGLITIAQFAVLEAGTAHPAPDQQSVSELSGLDASTAATVITRMAREGWLTRELASNGRRRRLLRFTPAARLAARWASAGLQEVDDQVFGVLGTQRRARLEELLQHLLKSAPGD